MLVSDDIRIDNRLLPYLLLQRTELARLAGFAGFPGLDVEILARVESFFRSRQIKSGYIQLITREFDSIAKSLPEKAANILDIGCGVALLDLFLFNHYYSKYKQGPGMYLLDKTAIDKMLHYSFTDKPSYYNSLEESHDLLAVNGVPENNIHLIEAGRITNFGSLKFDLVVSILSMGFHYPVETYFPGLLRNMNDDASLIVDIRKKTPGLEILNKCFNNVNVICEGEKHNRVLASEKLALDVI